MPVIAKTKQDLKDLKCWKHNEYIAHKLPYILQKSDSKQTFPEKISVFDEDGLEREYMPKKVEGVHAGLVCFVLTPTDPDNTRVHVIFRGTHNRVSAQRNLKANAPGSTSFNAHKAKIMHAIEQSILAVNHNSKGHNKVALTIGGHSLGGADAQHCSTMVLSEIAMNPSGALGASVGTLNIIHKNSAGVSAKAARVAAAAVEAIKGNNKTRELNINYYPIMIGGDGVQQTGYTNILSDMPADQVNTKLLKADIGKEGAFSLRAMIFDGPISTIKKALRNTYVAHKFKIFDEDTNLAKLKIGSVNIKVFSNATFEDRAEITKELNNKVLQNVLKNLKSTIKPVLSMPFSSKRQKVMPTNTATHSQAKFDPKI